MRYIIHCIPYLEEYPKECLDHWIINDDNFTNSEVAKRKDDAVEWRR